VLKLKDKACLTGLEEDLSYFGLMRPGPGPCLLLSRFCFNTMVVQKGHDDGQS
jgi:hypothetical protein